MKPGKNEEDGAQTQRASSSSTYADFFKMIVKYAQEGKIDPREILQDIAANKHKNQMTEDKIPEIFTDILRPYFLWFSCFAVSAHRFERLSDTCKNRLHNCRTILGEFNAFLEKQERKFDRPFTVMNCKNFLLHLQGCPTCKEFAIPNDLKIKKPTKEQEYLSVQELLEIFDFIVKKYLSSKDNLSYYFQLTFNEILKANKAFPAWALEMYKQPGLKEKFADQEKFININKVALQLLCEDPAIVKWALSEDYGKANTLAMEPKQYGYYILAELPQTITEVLAWAYPDNHPMRFAQREIESGQDAEDGDEDQAFSLQTGQASRLQPRFR